MLSYIWPLALVVVSNIVYQICAKSAPASMNPLASLTVTYAVGALVSGALYFLLNKDGSLLQEYRSLNWAKILKLSLMHLLMYIYSSEHQLQKNNLLKQNLIWFPMDGEEQSLL